jgi:hypothetical protein
VTVGGIPRSAAVIGAILGALGEASAGLGGAAGAVGATEAAQGFGQLGKQLGQLESVTGKLSPSMQKLVGAFTLLPNKILEAEKALVTVTDTYVHALAAPVETIKALGDSVSRFVRLSNPASVTMFEYKVENAFASIGKILEPILVSLGHAADKANEAMNKLAPAFDPLIDATVEVVDLVGNGLIPAFRELAPTLKLSGEMTFAMVKGLEVAGRAMGPFTAGIHALFGLVNQVVGGAFDENASKSVAARQVHLSSIEAIQREGAQRSIMATLAAQEGKAPPQTQESLLQQILDALRLISTKEGWDIIGGWIGEEVRKHLPDVPRLAAAGPAGFGAGDLVARILALRAH